MSTFLRQEDSGHRLAALAEHERRAWRAYVELTSDLTGETYAQTEADAWERLEAERVAISRGRARLLSSLDASDQRLGRRP
jgi:hypothetical protein